MKRIFAILAFCLLFAGAVRAQMIVLKTDVLKDALMIPDLGIDFVVGNKHSLGIGLFGCDKPWGEDIRLLGVSSQFRYWFNGRPFTRQFVGASLMAVNYDIHWKKDIYEGNAAAAGIVYGHVFNLSSRFNFELCGGVALLVYKQKQYYKGDYYSDYGERANGWGAILFPKLNVAVSYIIK